MLQQIQISENGRQRRPQIAGNVGDGIIELRISLLKAVPLHAKLAELPVDAIGQVDVRSSMTDNEFIADGSIAVFRTKEQTAKQRAKEADGQR